MSDLMTLGVVNMPYDMAMDGELSRRQYHSRANELARKYTALLAEHEALLARVEAAPKVKVRGKVGELATICVSHDMVGQTVRLLRVG